jgi:zinc-binding in reverse transcriptase
MQFSVRSVYNFLTDTPHIKENIFKLWEIKAPLRVQIFIWLQLRNKLLTTDNMRSRGWIVISMCHLCRRHEENIVHMFAGCEFTRQIRNYIADKIPTSRQCCDTYKKSDSPQKLLTGPYDMFWCQLEAATTFVVWRERCRHIFSRQSARGDRNGARDT